MYMYIVLLKALAKFISSNSESPNNPFWTGINVTPPPIIKRYFQKIERGKEKKGLDVMIFICWLSQHCPISLNHVI